VNKLYQNDVAVYVPKVLLPKKGTDYYKWAVVACDQFTSQPEYWEESGRIVENSPSTLDLILPEAYLGRADEEEKIVAIRKCMHEYLDKGILEEKPEGFVLVARSVDGVTRNGLVMALDLEAYNYEKGASTLIRATEETIVSRIPPRLKIREGAPIELPHVIVLIDDPCRTVIEPLVQKREALPTLYDTILMQDGGHVVGHLVSEKSDIIGVLDALSELKHVERFGGNLNQLPMLFAVGDGNHSLATAKANWDNIKAKLTEREWQDHPARYALVEVENVHDKGIIFEPIHRVIFNVSGDRAIDSMLCHLSAQNGSACVELGRLPSAAGGDIHILPFITGYQEGAFIIKCPNAKLAVGTLQKAIDGLLREIDDARVDYVHGEAIVKELSHKGGAIGFLLPPMKKNELFSTIIGDGVLPRKTFSMGEANEKRYYIECRCIE